MSVTSGTSYMNDVLEWTVGSRFDALVAVMKDVGTQVEQSGSGVMMLGTQINQGGGS